ncbi:uncharacterized protein [Dermacentor andersoni]|uniref:uncharacterized protein isoform X1 n=1 Tax=Dermacentor andersoni TaxID=34620 RepID=UPI0024159EFB|nr:uncharacterized protein LOC126540484 [Dermacentor andersoni]
MFAINDSLLISCDAIISVVFITLLCSSFTMKTCLWLALLSVVTVAYGATLVPQVGLGKPVLPKEAEADALEKAGKALETVGRLLQGENVALNEEVQEHLVNALRVASNNGEVFSEDDSEYFLPIIIRGVVQGAIAHVVHKKLNKG